MARELIVPFSRPHFAGDEAAAIGAVIAGGWVTQGPKVAELEKAFAARVGARHAVACCNGTAALFLCLHALGVGPSDEVIVPSLSFIATANAVRQCGARPVFADVQTRTYNLDPVAAEAAITPRTRAIMPVHQIGLAADMDDFARLAERYDLLLLADGAPAVGAKLNGREMGELGCPTCFSLHARKVITTGEGGIVTTDDPQLAAALRRLRHHGMDVSDLERSRCGRVIFESYVDVGFNYRLSDIHAALGLCQLGALDRILARRREVARRYSEALRESELLELPYEPPGHVHSWQSYAIRLRPDLAARRTELMQLLLDDGIATRRGVSAIHHEPPYRDRRIMLPNTEAAARESLLLPLYPDLDEGRQSYVIERLLAHLHGRRSTQSRRSRAAPAASCAARGSFI
ncbi:MAG TPA: DegT/DnrJ/EryC1/StrS family aminotransferase [Solirubrobacteraceae bacterium]|nr:DegT/DnrJ/EryC1/StrS family aminotransferase [Solirubrobacteraceae bacterium]